MKKHPFHGHNISGDAFDVDRVRPDADIHILRKPSRSSEKNDQ
jgi:hypothetical protein